MKKFLDFDKKKEILYNNIWLDDIKIVVKIPMICEKKYDKKIKMEKFDLSDSLYILSY
ncbi:MAG: hypothetical protein ACTSQP_09780 [Promethearchaeota archaeon]